MRYTQYLEIDNLITTLATQIQSILKSDFVGMYLHGSATAGDFDPKLSDVDLVVVTNKFLSESVYSKLKKMHEQIAQNNIGWKDRIEVWYVTANGLKNFRETRSEVAVISPGEPFHIKDMGEEKLISWYVVRQNSIAISGPSAKELIPDISIEEYKDAIKKVAIAWREAKVEYTPESTRGSAAYVVFTLSRALYGYTHHEQASKIKSVEWVEKTYPQWKELIQSAIKWRQVQWEDKQETVGKDLSKIFEYVDFTTGLILK